MTRRRSEPRPIIEGAYYLIDSGGSLPDIGPAPEFSDATRQAFIDRWNRPSTVARVAVTMAEIAEMGSLSFGRTADSSQTEAP